MQYNRGDTIVELMLAFSIFSLAAVGTIAIMNKGIAMSQQSLEISLVRAQMDSQAETIRYLRDTSSPLWDTIKSRVTTSIAPLAPSVCPSSDEIASQNGFFLNGSTLVTGREHFVTPTTYAQLNGSMSSGLWLQIARAEGSTVTSHITAYDVYIHACWDSLVNDSVPATLGTIVRVYDR